MAIPPSKIPQGIDFEQAKPLIDDNFNKVVQNVSDLGAVDTNTITVPFTSIASGGSFRQVIAIMNPGETHPTYPTLNLPKAQTSIVAIHPRADLYVDTDNDVTLRVPYGSALTSAQQAIIPNITLEFTPRAGALASILITGQNFGVGTRNYYFHLVAAVFPGSSGQFR